MEILSITKYPKHKKSLWVRLTIWVYNKYLRYGKFPYYWPICIDRIGIPFKKEDTKWVKNSGVVFFTPAGELIWVFPWYRQGRGVWIDLGIYTWFNSVPDCKKWWDNYFSEYESCIVKPDKG